MNEEVTHPSVEELSLPKVLAALADPARLADAGLEVGKSTMSHHSRILREAGITHARVQGARRMLTLRREDLDARFPGLLDAILQEELAATR